jgi:hypothetical protein
VSAYTIIGVAPRPPLPWSSKRRWHSFRSRVGG